MSQVRQGDLDVLDLPLSVRRASLALKVLAGLYAAGIVFASLPGSAPASLLDIVAFNVANGGFALLFVVVALSLDRGKGWAAGIIRPLLALLVVWGAYTLLTQVAAGLFRIPTTMIIAGVALFMPADGWPATRLTVRGAIVLVLVAALCVHQTVSRALWGWGGYFDVTATDLHASVAVECGSGEPPDRLRISYEWSWSDSVPLPNDEDQIVVGWEGDGVEGRPLYGPIDLPAETDAIQLGVSNGPSGRMAKAIKDTWRGGFMVRLDMHQLEFGKGRIEAELVRTAAQPVPDQTVVFGASYVHAGVWRSDLPTVTCSW
jgi:hypothetical protein